MFTFAGFHLPKDGYGYATIKIAESLVRQHLARGLNLFKANVEDAEQAFKAAVGMTWDVAGDMVALCTPDWLPDITTSGGLVSYCMHEATKLPPNWADILNARARAVIVPCEWNRQVFADNGVRAPIRVVKWGIDPRDYFPLERPADRPFTFLWSGTPDLRKGWDVAYRAFARAFGKNDDARLVMHFRKPLPGNPRFADANVRLVVGVFDRPALRDLLREADCFVFPSRGEGWGLPPREAAATGLPVIATNWGGLAEDLPCWGLPLRVKGLSKASYGYYDDVGEWAEPDVDELVELMRLCYDSRDYGRAFGARAAAWLAAFTPWDVTARNLADAVAEAMEELC